MRWSRLMAGLLVAAILFVTPLSAWAQEPLPQKFTSADGSLTYSYPAGWEVQEDVGTTILTNNLAALEEEALPPGVVAALIVQPLAVSSLVGSLEDTSPVGVTLALAEQLTLSAPTTQPTTMTIAGRAAARLPLTVDIGDVLLFALEVGTDLPVVVVAIAASGELAQFEPTLLAVMETIEYAPAWRAALRGHTDWVNAVAFSPDGTRMASGSDDSTVRIWEVGTGKELLTIEQPGFVTGVAFAPSGAQVAAANTDGSVELWDATSGAEVLRIEAHDGYVRSVTFSPDGAHLASGGDDYLVRVWDAVTGEAQVTLEGHEAAVNSVAYNPDGTRVASASDDSTVRIWDASTGGQLLSIEHPDWVNAVAFSPDGAWLVSGSDDGVVRVWDAATGELLAELTGHQDYVNSVAFSPDGNYIVSGSDDSTVIVWWDLDLMDHSARESMVLRGHADWVNAVAFSPDGSLIASASDDGSVLLWDAPR